MKHFGFDDHNPPTLELLDDICKDVAEWLDFDQRNVAALHCASSVLLCCCCSFAALIFVSPFFQARLGRVVRGLSSAHIWLTDIVTRASLRRKVT